MAVIFFFVLSLTTSLYVSIIYSFQLYTYIDESVYMYTCMYARILVWQISHSVSFRTLWWIKNSLLFLSTVKNYSKTIQIRLQFKINWYLLSSILIINYHSDEGIVLLSTFFPNHIIPNDQTSIVLVMSRLLLKCDPRCFPDQFKRYHFHSYFCILASLVFSEYFNNTSDDQNNTKKMSLRS